jgi:hypothetical protein
LLFFFKQGGGVIPRLALYDWLLSAVLFLEFPHELAQGFSSGQG